MSELAESPSEDGPRDEDRATDPERSLRPGPSPEAPESLDGLATQAFQEAPSPGTTEAASRPVTGPDFGETPAPPVSGDFELREEIGRGAMGVVYRATQKSLDREVAVKTVAPDRVSPRVLARFEKEARITGVLDHPNIVPIYDFAIDPQGRAMLAMKLVEGRSWKTLLAEREVKSFDLVAHLRLLIQVCHAVAFVHSKGIAHCDLKPANVMIGRFGEVLVMDWGIAVAFRSGPAAARATPRAQVTRPGGTPCYMAPELARGDGRSLGPGTDIYLLGAILYELINGHPPHTGADRDACVATAAAAGPLKFDKDCPDELAQLCRGAMASTIEDRPESVDAFREAIEAYLSHRESLRVAEQAEALAKECRFALSQARAGQQTSRDDLYADFNEAIAGFRQALFLWPENPKAERAELAARLAYAEAALVYGDLGLAETQAARAARADGAEDLLRLIVETRAERAQEEQAAGRLRKLLAIAVLILAMGGSASAFLIRDAWRESRRRQVFLDLKLLDDLKEENEELWPARLGSETSLREWLERARALLASRANHAAALAAIDSADDSTTTNWERRTLNTLLGGADGKGGLKRLEEVLIPEVEIRLERAMALSRLSENDEERRELWRQKRPDLPYQENLIPLGKDPQSGREEFAVALTGKVPERRNGRLDITDDAALILVHLPGGAFEMGALDDDSSAMPRERPARDAKVDSFLISKYEMTQAQYRTITGRNPSLFQTKSAYNEKYKITPRHPVERVSWNNAARALAAIGLALPNEAEWEYAQRAGTRTPWWCGSDLLSLLGYENLSDRAHHLNGAQMPCEPLLDDGHVIHAPVGLFKPNPFGLHDMGGNVQEWCADSYRPPSNASKPGAPPPPDHRIFRGGAWSKLPRDARSSARFHNGPDYQSISLGLRPILRLR